MNPAGMVHALGYVRLRVRNGDAWAGFAAEVLGLEAVAEAPAGERRYRVDERAWRLALCAADSDGLDAVGWEVADAAALDALGERLTAAGVAVEPAPAALAAERGVRGLLRCTDPGGTPLELFWGGRLDVSPVVSPRGVRFVTGDLGMGHVVIAVERSSYADTLDFYRDLLGFRTSDHMRSPGGDVTFLHCNPRHHSLALGEWDTGPQLMHFMLEADSIDAVGHALDAACAHGATVKRMLGRHSNDRMISFYVQTPSGFDVEYGHGGRLVDDATWSVTEIARGTLWGHRPPAVDGAQ